MPSKSKFDAADRWLEAVQGRIALVLTISGCLLAFALAYRVHWMIAPPHSVRHVILLFILPVSQTSMATVAGLYLIYVLVTTLSR